jgi:Smg protein
MIDILVYLFENYTSLSASPEPGLLARKLSAVGFQADEIGAALDWLAPLHEQQPDERLPATGIRIYTEEEHARLGRDCLGFLMFLESSGFVSPTAREVIVERSLALDDDPVPLEKFKIIVLMVLWRSEQPLEPLIVEELLTEESDLSLLH